MKTKTSELTGAALDWAVCVIEKQHLSRYTKYSTDWAQGGPVIEREKVCVAWLTKQDLGMEPEHYCVAHIDGVFARYGPTFLIAAMRCFVSSRLGDEVDIPEELQ